LDSVSGPFSLAAQRICSYGHDLATGVMEMTDSDETVRRMTIGRRDTTWSIEFTIDPR
jgi:hypothetical protein